MFNPCFASVDNHSFGVKFLLSTFQQYLYLYIVAAPGPPDSLKAKPKDGKIALSWKPPKDNGWSKIEKYHIYMSEVSGPKVLLEAVEATFNSYNVDNLSAEKQYYFEVVAENGVGCGEATRTDKPVSLKEQKKGNYIIS